MCQIFTARKTQFLIVNDRQLEILAGCLLGDGSIYKKGAVQIEQGEKQKDYLMWKYEELKSLVSVNPRKITRIRKDGKTSCSYRFVLKQYFRRWRKKIYRDSRKVINSTIINLLTPLSLAVWYMDDGCLRSNSQIILCTDGYSKNSLKTLRQHLARKWGIKTKIKLKREPKIQKVYERLTVGSTCMVKFLDIIRPYIIPSMTYKILDPVTTRSIRRVRNK